MREKIRRFMIEYAYLVTIFAVLAVVAGSAVYTRSLQRARDTGVQAAAPAPEIQVPPSPTPRITPLPTIAPIVVRPMQLGGGTVRPVSGGVLRAHDAQTAVYWPSLETWQAHSGLDLAGEAGENVRSLADGTVIRAARDALWGWRIAVEQADGHVVTYAGLESSQVAEGQTVARGQALGTLLGRTPAEGEMPAHLHIESRRNGIMQDPEVLLPER